MSKGLSAGVSSPSPIPITFSVLRCIISNLRLRNQRGHTLQCSHYVALPFPEDTPLPCAVYCHGSSGCRADANEAAVILLPSNITVFALDFSGSGLSDGDYARNLSKPTSWIHRHA
ncbi:hypothetical protein ACSBR1_014076 [Camellia fascicularis]